MGARHGKDGVVRLRPGVTRIGTSPADGGQERVLGRTPLNLQTHSILYESCATISCKTNLPWRTPYLMTAGWGALMPVELSLNVSRLMSLQ